jgi:hypothetical protein
MPSSEPTVPLIAVRADKTRPSGLQTIPHIGLSVGNPYTIPVNISRGMVGYHPTTTIIPVLTQGSTRNDPQSTQMGAGTLEPRISTSLSPTLPSEDTLLSPSYPTWSQN